MKRIVILTAVLLLFGISLFAQNILDPAPLDFDRTYIAEQDSVANEFKIGWNWGSIGYKLDEAMLVNYLHQVPIDIDNADLLGNNIRTIIQPRCSGGHMHAVRLNAASFTFDPAITADSTKTARPHSWDNTGAVFGFFNKNRSFGSVDSIQSSSTFHRYVLNKAGLANETVVLSDSWPNDKYEHFDYSKYYREKTDSLFLHPFGWGRDRLYPETAPVSDTLFHNNYNGMYWYLSINLKSLEDIILSAPEDTVLKIRLLYTLDDSLGTQDTIKFSKLPGNSLDSLTTIQGSYYPGDFRGMTRKEQLVSEPIKYFPVTTKMLMADALGSANQDITLSALFMCRASQDPIDSIKNYRHFNPYLQLEEDWESGHDTADSTHIKNMEIEVTYCGNKNVAIDWIRVETPGARQLLRGERDDYVKAALDTVLKPYINNTKNAKLFRFYSVDEFLISHLPAMRYFHLLCDSLSTSEFVLESLGLPYAQLNHAVNYREYWDGGATLSNPRVKTAAPYIRSAGRYCDNGISCEDYDGECLIDQAHNVYFPTLNLGYGYEGYWYPPSPSEPKDTLESFYETFLYSAVCNNEPPAYHWWHYEYIDRSNIPCDLLANEDKYRNNSYQINYERRANEFINNSSDFLFAEKPVWANIWGATSGWTNNTDTSLYTDTNLYQKYNGERPRTGEEFRHILQTPIIIGLKGLMHWIGKSNYKSSYLGYAAYPYNTAFHAQLPVGFELLRSNVIGGDFWREDDYTVLPTRKSNFSMIFIL